MAASLLTALDLTELITSSLEQYERIAVDLALNPLKLNALREKLNHIKNTSILFDSAKMTKKISKRLNINRLHFEILINFTI
jgi:predicted O-linked N-acetylglucosamine transferase (SPINDLY family)